MEATETAATLLSNLFGSPAGSRKSAQLMVSISTLSHARTQVKVIVVGDSGVGKSSLIRRWAYGSFDPNCPTTMGVDYTSPAVVLPAYFHGCDACLLVYDASSPKSFAHLRTWHELLRRYSTCIAVLVANKTDKAPQSVSPAAAAELCAEWGARSFEVSCLTGDNVDAALSEVVVGCARRKDPEASALEEESMRIADAAKSRTAVARDAANDPRNRYHDVLPYDETRVVLSKQRTESDYINASWISEEGKQRAYIATQAPLESTVVDFWRMVWETETPIIVMLESNTGRAHKYWPSHVGETLSYGELGVTLERSREIADGAIVQRVLALRCEGGRRDVYHYQYVEWPDYGVPSSTRAMRAFIDTLFDLHGRPPPRPDPGRAHKYWPSHVGETLSYGELGVTLERSREIADGAIVQRVLALRCEGGRRDVYHYQYVEWPDYGVPSSTRAMRAFIDTLFDLHGRPPPRPDPVALPWPPGGRRLLPQPIVVHCSAGVGRTGTFIAVMAVVQRMLAQVSSSRPVDFDVFGTVSRMRRERQRMVQRAEQYLFVYAVVIEEARELGAVPGCPG
eukprot:m51a1_g11581 putative tyrosine-protein phosphatase non-receptor type 18-like (567) ;mRNA; f:46724-51512